eukprot:13233626-Alexandrium_andersonii.AAC.1
MAERWLRRNSEAGRADSADGPAPGGRPARQRCAHETAGRIAQRYGYPPQGRLVRCYARDLADCFVHAALRLQ